MTKIKVEPRILTSVRLWLYLHIAWVALIGLLCRGILSIPDFAIANLPRWASNSLEFAVAGLPVYAFPWLVIISLRRSAASAVEFTLVVVIEVALFIAYCVAIAPALQ